MKIKFDNVNGEYAEDHNEVMENLVRNLNGVTIDHEVEACGVKILEVTATDTATDILVTLSDCDMISLDY